MVIYIIIYESCLFNYIIAKCFTINPENMLYYVAIFIICLGYILRIVTFNIYGRFVKFIWRRKYTVNRYTFIAITEL